MIKKKKIEIKNTLNKNNIFFLIIDVWKKKNVQLKKKKLLTESYINSNFLLFPNIFTVNLKDFNFC